MLGLNPNARSFVPLVNFDKVDDVGGNVSFQESPILYNTKASIAPKHPEFSYKSQTCYSITSRTRTYSGNLLGNEIGLLNTNEVVTPLNILEAIQQRKQFKHNKKRANLNNNEKDDRDSSRHKDGYRRHHSRQKRQQSQRRQKSSNQSCDLPIPPTLHRQFESNTTSQANSNLEYRSISGKLEHFTQENEFPKLPSVKVKAHENHSLSLKPAYCSNNSTLLTKSHPVSFVDIVSKTHSTCDTKDIVPEATSPLEPGWIALTGSQRQFPRTEPIQEEVNPTDPASITPPASTNNNIHVFETSLNDPAVTTLTLSPPPIPPPGIAQTTNINTAEMRLRNIIRTRTDPAAKRRWDSHWMSVVMSIGTTTATDAPATVSTNVSLEKAARVAQLDIPDSASAWWHRVLAAPSGMRWSGKSPPADDGDDGGLDTATSYSGYDHRNHRHPPSTTTSTAGSCDISRREKRGNLTGHKNPSLATSDSNRDIDDVDRDTNHKFKTSVGQENHSPHLKYVPDTHTHTDISRNDDENSHRSGPAMSLYTGLGDDDSHVFEEGAFLEDWNRAINTGDLSLLQDCLSRCHKSTLIKRVSGQSSSRKGSDEGSFAAIEDTATAITSHPIDLSDLAQKALFALAEKGYTSCLEAVYQRFRLDLNLDRTDSQKKTALLTACEGGHIECVSRLIQLGARVEMSDRLGEGLFHKAAKSGSKELIAWLCNKRGLLSCQINNKNKNLQTPLMVAAMFAGREVAQTLINAGAGTSYRDVMGRDAASLAARRGDVKVLDAILTCNCKNNINNNNDVNYMNNSKNRRIPSTRLRQLSFSSQLTCSRQSITFETSPLHQAAEIGDVACIRLLLQRGHYTSLSQQDAPGGCTPLMLACGKAHLLAMRELLYPISSQKALDNGRSVRGVDRDDVTASATVDDDFGWSAIVYALLGVPGPPMDVSALSFNVTGKASERGDEGNSDDLPALSTNHSQRLECVKLLVEACPKCVQYVNRFGENVLDVVFKKISKAEQAYVSGRGIWEEKLLTSLDSDERWIQVLFMGIVVLIKAGAAVTTRFLHRFQAVRSREQIPSVDLLVLKGSIRNATQQRLRGCLCPPVGAARSAAQYTSEELLGLDTCLMAHDGQVYVHGFMLRARSPVFEAMLTSPMVELKDNHIDGSLFKKMKVLNFPQHSKNSLETMIKWIYDGVDPTVNCTTHLQNMKASLYLIDGREQGGSEGGKNQEEDVMGMTLLEDVIELLFLSNEFLIEELQWLIEERLCKYIYFVEDISVFESICEVLDLPLLGEEVRKERKTTRIQPSAMTPPLYDAQSVAIDDEVTMIQCDCKEQVVPGCCNPLVTLDTAFSPLLQENNSISSFHLKPLEILACSDILLVSGEGTTFHAHSAVLCAHSPKFAAMLRFYQHVEECNEVLHGRFTSLLEETYSSKYDDGDLADGLKMSGYGSRKGREQGLLRVTLDDFSDAMLRTFLEYVYCGIILFGDKDTNASTGNLTRNGAERLTTTTTTSSSLLDDRPRILCDPIPSDIDDQLEQMWVLLSLLWIADEYLMEDFQNYLSFLIVDRIHDSHWDKGGILQVIERVNGISDLKRYCAIATLINVERIVDVEDSILMNALETIYY